MTSSDSKLTTKFRYWVQQEIDEWTTFLTRLLDTIISIPCSIFAIVVAKILENPRVQTAAVETLVRGMNATLEQPEMPRKVVKMYLQLQDDPDVARALGESLPKAAKNYIAGVASSVKRSISFSSLEVAEKPCLHEEIMSSYSTPVKTSR